MTAALDVPREAAPVRQEWLRLAAATVRPPAFDESMIADLPEAVQRWLAHAIAARTPLWQAVQLSMHGHIKLGSWRPFTATQVIAPPHGYIWAATARLAGLPVAGYDRLSSGTGQMNWRLLHLIRLMSASGPDVTRSACGRLAGEIVLLPTAFQSAFWAEGSDADEVTATWHFGPGSETARLRVGASGQLTEVVVDRWGNPNGAPFGRYPFGVSFAAESDFRGITIPSTLRAGWWWGTQRQQDGEFFRAEITAAEFR
jgi:hypothetical protein